MASPSEREIFRILRCSDSAYYAVLGVDHDSDTNDMEEAFAKKARLVLTHNDAHLATQAAQRMSSEIVYL